MTGDICTCSSLNDLLKEDDVSTEVNAIAIKRVIAWQLLERCNAVAKALVT
jgi:hypothetical protein